MTVALGIPWLGTYWISPMHPVLAAPAWAFSYAFAALVEVWPSIMRHVTLDHVIALSHIANLLAWSLLCYGCLVVARRIAHPTHPVV